MSIRRFIANKDNTITNAFKANLVTRGTQANMGASDILEVFSIFGQANSSSLEQARILVEFPISEIKTSRDLGEIPASGSTSFKLKLFNAPHGGTTPSDFKISVFPVSSPWSEGSGLDMEDYSDIGVSNWVSSSKGTPWTTLGGDYLQKEKVQSFASGLENLEVDITETVESWIAEESPNYGFLIKLSGSAESGSDSKSFYTKKFFGRGSEYYLKRPVIEAQFDLSIQDDRSQIIKSSSLAPSNENLNKIFLYNRFRGNLVDIPDTAGSELLVSFSTASHGHGPYTTVVNSHGHETIYITASRQSTGVYSAEFAYSGSSEFLFDIWRVVDASEPSGHKNLLVNEGFSISEDKVDNSMYTDTCVASIPNMKPSYSKEEKITFRVNFRKKNWSPNVYSVATNNSKTSLLRESYYKIVRVSDNYEVISYSTASAPYYSKLSYDVSGSYFDLDMSILQPNYLYEIRILSKQGLAYREQKERFKFRVD